MPSLGTQEASSSYKGSQGSAKQAITKSSEKSAGGWLFAWASGVCSLDSRSLAAYRILLAVSVLHTLWLETVPFMEEFLTDEDNSMWLRRDQMGRDPFHPSILLGSGAFCAAASLVAFESAAAVALLVGWRTKAANVAVWAAHMSLMNRHTAFWHGGDTWTAVLLFYSMFLPLDRHWAIRPSSSHSSPNSVLSVATFAHWSVVTQLYVINWLAKAKSLGWQEGSAVLDAFGDCSLTTWIGVQARAFPGACQFFTDSAMFVEGPMPLLGFFVPWAPVRFLCQLSIIGMHLSFIVTFHLGHFPLICIAGLVATLPGGMWTALGFPAVIEKKPKNSTKFVWFFCSAAKVLQLMAILAAVGWTVLALRVYMQSRRFTLSDGEFSKHVMAVPWQPLARVAGGGLLVTAGLEFVLTEFPSLGSSRTISVAGKFARGIAVALALTVSTLRSNKSEGFGGISDTAEIKQLAHAVGIEIPCGMFANDFLSREMLIVIPGFASHDPSRIMDWYPWPEQHFNVPREILFKLGMMPPAAPRELNQSFPRPDGGQMGLRFPTSRWEMLFRSDPAHDKMWERLASAICSRYAVQNLIAFEIYMIHGDVPGLLRPRPLKRLLASKYCNSSGATKILRLSSVTQAMDEEFASRFPTSQAQQALEPLVRQTGVKVRYKSGLPSYGNRIKPGQHGVVLQAKPGSVTPPLFVRWLHEGTQEYWNNTLTSQYMAFTNTYWVHWEMLDLVEPREVVLRKQAQERDMFERMPTGVRVRMLRKFEKVGRGFLGEFLRFSINAWPHVKVKWTTTRSHFIYFVHAMDIEVVEADAHRVCSADGDHSVCVRSMER